MCASIHSSAITSRFLRIERKGTETLAAAKWKKFRNRRRVSRYVGGGFHEDLELTNFTQHETRFTFSILLMSDFIDRNELHSGRQQFGQLTSDWRWL
jgi:N-terminal domain of (some) glycogen debranching enzymes